MSNSINLTFIEKWINNVSIYPPAEIFFQAPKSQEKKEKRCKEICESLYRFNWEDSPVPNPIGTVREIVREMVVVDKLFEYNRFPPDYQNILKLLARFLKAACYLIDQLNDMHKEHEKLSEWYLEWRRGQLHIMMNANRWGADILRLPTEGEYANQIQKQFLDDVSQTMEEMK